MGVKIGWIIQVGLQPRSQDVFPELGAGPPSQGKSPGNEVGWAGNIELHPLPISDLTSKKNMSYIQTKSSAPFAITLINDYLNIDIASCQFKNTISILQSLTITLDRTISK